MKFAIFSRKDARSDELCEQIRKKLSWCYDEEDPDIVITVGGDGTILRAVDRYIKSDHVQFLGINSGHLGFYTNWSADCFSEAIDLLLAGKYAVTEFKLLEYQINNQEIAYALNEVAVHNSPSVQVIDVYIDAEHFETFRGSGLCISTPSGSTAYNKSLGGAIIDPQLDVIQLTEIASINSNAYRTLGASIVLPTNRYLHLLMGDDFEGSITADFKQIPVDKITSLDVKLSSKSVKFLTVEGNTFWQRVKNSFI